MSHFTEYGIVSKSKDHSCFETSPYSKCCTTYTNHTVALRVK